MKLCIDCVHFVEGDPHTCARTRTSHVDVVDGKETTTWRSCKEERKFTHRPPRNSIHFSPIDSVYYRDRCGPDAQYWSVV